MPKSLRKNSKPIGKQDFDDSKGSMPDEDDTPLNDEKAPDGLTLIQAAIIYFGGLSLFVVGLVIIGISS